MAVCAVSADICSTGCREYLPLLPALCLKIYVQLAVKESLLLCCLCRVCRYISTGCRGPLLLWLSVMYLKIYVQLAVKESLLLWLSVPCLQIYVQLAVKEYLLLCPLYSV
jgi:hypothetical protein